MTTRPLPRAAIVYIAQMIMNASISASVDDARRREVAPALNNLHLAGRPAPLRFGWVQQIYGASWDCKNKNLNSSSTRRTCGYKYTDLASHPLAVLLPYSVHSYGVVQAYAMGVPLLVPSPKLLASWHTRFGMVGHKGPGNVPWRRSSERRQVPNDGYAWLTHNSRGWWSPVPADDAQGCEFEPNDACTEAASLAWLRHSEPYHWPHVVTFESIDELIAKARTLLGDSRRRRIISDGMKAFVRAEATRAEMHARVALQRALTAAQRQRRALATSSDSRV